MSIFCVVALYDVDLSANDQLYLSFVSFYEFFYILYFDEFFVTYYFTFLFSLPVSLI